MEIRFQAETKDDIHIFRIHTDGSSVTLSKFSSTNAKGDEVWKALGHYGSFQSAAKAGLRHGISAFPGTMQEILTALYTMEKSLVNSVAELDSVFAAKHQEQLNELLLTVDERLKVLNTEDRAEDYRQPLDRDAEDDSTEEASSEDDFMLDESDEFKLDFA